MALSDVQTLYFEDLSVGLRETHAKLVTSEDIVAFAEISGDRNPIHLSDEFAAKTPFGSRIAHGIFTASLISAVIGTRLPGPGAIYISQNLRFLAPVRIGDTVETSVEIVELIDRGRRAKLRCACKVGDVLVLEGEAEVKVPPRPSVA
ncbi:MaoC family dehydratase [Terricaulis sp.]|uniref:MaoC family dehydratase n=1 Tax=Terricaulis sp. TaxID=2768686 RepID=UPI002AC40428|nr:MaoC family dehydratase [Terricaulis sp.]MDZ4692561.1 MaoC family dehydratase [Terricaulis sp.]